MAKIVDNPNGFKVIRLSLKDRESLNFGDKCDVCGDYKKLHMYYIAALNNCVCKDCYDDIVDNTYHENDPDSIKYENRNFDYYANQLGLINGK